MLTGEPPFRGTPAMVVHQVLEEEPRPPRQLSEAIPRDLETICLKTLAKDPIERYPSTALLAADLRHWLAGEPIVARPIGRLGRLVRWARRNRGIAALGATSVALLIMLAAGALVAAIRIDRARRLEVAERIRADRNAQDARLAADVAAEKARVAVDQRTLALETISTLVKEVQDQLGQSNGTLRLRRRLADAAIARLERIANDPAGGADVELARVMAHERLGELSFLAGRTDAAHRHYETARDSALRLASSAVAADTTAEANRIAALCLDKLGDLALYEGKLDLARTSYQQALDLRESLPDSAKSSPDGLRNRAVSQNKLGDVAMRSGRLDLARQCYERGLALTERDQDPDPQRHRFDLRFVHSRLGDVALARFDFDEADRAYRRALEYALEQIAADPSDPRARRDVAVCYSKLGGAALRQGNTKAALEAFGKYLSGSQELANANPSSAEARRDLMVAQSFVADAHWKGADYAAAESAYRRVYELAVSLARDDPRSAQKRADIAEIVLRLADVSCRREQFDAAGAWLERAQRMCGISSRPA